jgi:hypothetical protein
MDTKERKTGAKTPLQDTSPAPGSVYRTQELAPDTAKAAKSELEKPKSISRGVRKIFFGSFFSGWFWVAAHAARRSSNRLRPRRQARRRFFSSSFSQMQNDQRSLFLPTIDQPVGLSSTRTFLMPLEYLLVPAVDQQTFWMYQ